MELKFKCLVLDHDDTTVKSTPEIHYPQWLETLDALRPGTTMGLEEFMKYNFYIGFFRMCREVLAFTPEESVAQDKMWREYTAARFAHFYEGMPEIIRDFKAAGGIVCVATHSNSANILRDYEKQGVEQPDMIFGYDLGEDKIKPSPYALNEIMRIYGFKPNEILMVDDMKPGYDMAKSVGVPFACAGWSHIVPEIREYMKDCCENYLENTGELRSLILK